ncbi:MAG: hypothetical protein JRF33_16000 [Deltaproteobacteria bacterium]|nr:hypothetical protein [Deltaproteobacteria bacterium]
MFSQAPRSRWVLKLGMVLVFLGALLGLWLRAGSSPRIWVDTLNDERQVITCLAGYGSCELHGAPVSFGHLLQGASWQEMRAAMVVAGLDLESSHILWLALEAACWLLLVLAGLRLGGPGGALLAGLLGLASAESCECWRPMLWNFRPLFALGILALALMFRLAGPGDAQRRTKFLTATLLGAVIGISQSIHLVSLILVPGMVLAALLSVRFRWGCLLVSLASLTSVALLSSVGGWEHNLDALLSWQWLPDSNRMPSAPGAPWFNLPFVLGLIALATLIAGLRFSPSSKRFPGWIGLAVLVTGLGLFGLGQSLFALTPTDRYLLPVMPAVALSLAWAWGRLLDSGRLGLARLGNLLGKNEFVLGSLVMLALAMAIWPEAGRCENTMVTVRAQDDLYKKTIKKLGWSPKEMMVKLRGAGVHQIWEPWVRLPGTKLSSEKHDGFELFGWHLVPLEKRDVITKAYDLAGDDQGPTWFLVPVRRRADWAHPELCWNSSCRELEVEPPFDFSVKAAYQIKGFPDPARSKGEMRIKYQIRPAQKDSVAMVYWVPDFAPCRARLGVRNCPNCEVDVDQEWARFPAGSGGILVLNFSLGSQTCPRHAYQGFPPWVAELSDDDYGKLRNIIILDGKK